MNDPILCAKKLEDLIDLARQAESAFEKAAVFAATQSLADAFFADEDQFNSYALEKVEQARLHICASIGYDITNGHDEQQHRAWALGAIHTLQDVLSKG
nr:hypothetical protein [uncultured Tolumonas sp.]